jgi:two-component system cell cycle response regulator
MSMHEAALDRLATMTQGMLDAHDRHERLQAVTDCALQLTPANHASVRLCAREGRLQVGARSGVGTDRPAPPFREGQGVLGWVAHTGKAARIADSKHDPRFAPNEARGFEVSSLLSVPVRVRGETRGVLSLSAPECAAFDEHHEAIAHLLSRMAAQAVLTSDLEQLAVTDSQTLAYNRRYLLPRLREEMERCSRHGRSLSVMLIDLDHFKRVNDRHGHAAGDAVLRAFADTVREQVRSIDVLVRRGGEEFVLIMPATARDAALFVAERLRAHMADHPLRVREGLDLAQTISVGVATWDGRESPEQVDERADQAMYEAKRRGRNQVIEAVHPAELRACSGR